MKTVVSARRPKKLYGENLKTLEATTPNHEYASDAEYIRQWFREQGYWCDTFIVHSDWHGSFTARVRWLLYCMRSDVK